MAQPSEVVRKIVPYPMEILTAHVIPLGKHCHSSNMNKNFGTHNTLKLHSHLLSSTILLGS